jgi:tRNA dimethylallyltransferase
VVYKGIDSILISENKKPIYAIAGPTASGKTEIGVALALHLGNAEIINCDSVQIYKEIEIATAKPSEREKRGVPHHLIDYVPPEINYTAADWARCGGKNLRNRISREHSDSGRGNGFLFKNLAPAVI